MKNLFFTLLFILPFCSVYSKPIFSDSLRIRFTSGDERYVVKEMFFYAKANNIFGRISIPNNDKLLSSEIRLDKESIDFLNSFLKIAKSYKYDCKEENVSTDVRCYEITLDKEVFKIFKFCDWKSFTYGSIEKKIFGHYLNRLKNKEEEFNLLYSAKIVGRWKENQKLENLKLDSKWYLSKIDSKSKEIEYLEFFKNQKVILSRNKRKIYYNYRIFYKNGEKYLEMLGDINKNGKEFIYGQEFKILELSNSKVKMVH